MKILLEPQVTTVTTTYNEISLTADQIKDLLGIPDVDIPNYGTWDLDSELTLEIFWKDAVSS